MFKPELEIHHINVSQGDSTLIVNRDIDKLRQKVLEKVGAADLPEDDKKLLPLAISKEIDISTSVRSSVLIDAGDGAYGEDVARYIYNHGIRKFTENVPFVTIATHYHEDHTEGFKYVFFKNYDREDGDELVENIVPNEAYDCGNRNGFDGTGTRKNYLEYVNQLTDFGSEGRKQMAPWTEIDMGKTRIETDQNSKEIAIKLKCIASNGYIVKDQLDRFDDMLNQGGGNQNDRSIVMVLEYGDFRYFFGGDLTGSGDNDGGNFGPLNLGISHSNYDLESWVRSALPGQYPKPPGDNRPNAGHICCFTANHHGSSYSNDVYLLEAMKPVIALCSSGIRKKFHFHPTAQYCNRVDSAPELSPRWQVPNGGEVASSDNSITGYYFTECADDGRYSHKEFTRSNENMRIMGDIVVRPVLDVESCNIEIQVYGSAEMSALRDEEDIKPRDASPPKTPPYNVGPFTHTCIHD